VVDEGCRDAKALNHAKKLRPTSSPFYKVKAFSLQDVTKVEIVALTQPIVIGNN